MQKIKRIVLKLENNTNTESILELMLLYQLFLPVDFYSDPSVILKILDKHYIVPQKLLMLIVIIETETS